MRSFEILLALLIGVQYLLMVAQRRGRRPQQLWVLAAMALALGLHLAFEGQRWQMIPAYGLCGVMLLLWLWRLGQKRHYLVKVQSAPGQKIKRAAFKVAGLFLVILLLLPAYLFPVFETPAPTGRHSVGLTWLPLRPASQVGGQELLLTVWYPSRLRPDQRPDPYMPQPPWFLNQLQYVQGHSFANAHLADLHQLMPVVIFTHELGGMELQNSQLCQELASQGYLVIAPGLPGEALFTRLGDGQGQLLNLTKAHALWDSVQGFPLAAFEAKQQPEERQNIDQIYWKNQPDLQQTLAQRRLLLWNLLDALEEINQGKISSLFVGRLDLTRIAMAGHGLGGTASLQACEGDQRCSLSILLDALPIGVQPPTKPLVAIHRPELTALSQFHFQAAEAPLLQVELPTEGHWDMTDLKWAAPQVRMRDVLGELSPEAVQTATNRMVFAFLQFQFYDQPSPLLQSQTKGLLVRRYGTWE